MVYNQRLTASTSRTYPVNKRAGYDPKTTRSSTTINNQYHPADEHQKEYPIYSRPEVTTEMIATGAGVNGTLADAARKSLDKEVDRLRGDGRLEAGKKTSERLGWTEETHRAAKEFVKVCLAQNPLRLLQRCLTSAEC